MPPLDPEPPSPDPLDPDLPSPDPLDPLDPPLALLPLCPDSESFDEFWFGWFLSCAMIFSLLGGLVNACRMPWVNGRAEKTGTGFGGGRCRLRANLSAARGD